MSKVIGGRNAYRVGQWGRTYLFSSKWCTIVQLQYNVYHMLSRRRRRDYVYSVRSQYQSSAHVRLESCMLLVGGCSDDVLFKRLCRHIIVRCCHNGVNGVQ